MYLAHQGLPFRGHRGYGGWGGGGGGSTEGCFIEFIKLLAKYDGLLSEHLNPKSTNYLYLIPKIQNEFISKEIIENISNEMKEVKFYSTIADSTIDIMKVDE